MHKWHQFAVSFIDVSSYSLFFMLISSAPSHAPILLFSFSVSHLKIPSTLFFSVAAVMSGKVCGYLLTVFSVLWPRSCVCIPVKKQIKKILYPVDGAVATIMLVLLLFKKDKNLPDILVLVSIISKSFFCWCKWVNSLNIGNRMEA